MSVAEPSDREPDDPTVAGDPVPEHASRATAVGMVLGRYVVIEQIGAGGMGSVARAYDPRLRREVAIKRVLADMRDESGQLRLLREARAMARLSHPHVVSVYDVEATNDGVYLAMEYVSGGTLRDWLNAEKRTLGDIMHVLRRAGEGLAAAHRAELVHRDFKPSNVLVAEDGRIKVTDFGLAKPMGSSSSGSGFAAAPSDDDQLTHAGTVMGTPRYMAPEQHAGREADARADQYAYCVTLWEALCGKAPFLANTLAELARAKQQGPPAWPRSVVVPRPVVLAIRRGLAPDPEQRWPTMSSLLAALERWQGRARMRRTALLLGSLSTLAGTGLGFRAWDEHRKVVGCETEGAQIEALWPARRDALAAGLARSGISYAATTGERLVPWLDAWADEWRSARMRSCVAAQIDETFSPELHERARACLDLGRVKIETLVELLVEGDPQAVQGAVVAVAAPSELHDCTDRVRLEQGPWPELAGSDAVTELRHRLARAWGFQLAGRYEEGSEEANAVLQEAQRLQYAPLISEARLRLGNLLQLRADYEDAEQQLRAAYFDAASAGADRIALDAAAMLVFTVGLRLARHDEGIDWGEHARVFATRLGETENLTVANLFNNLAAVHRAKGEHEQAEFLHGEALEIRERVLGGDHPDVATSLSNLALVLADAGKYEEARRLHARALDIRERALGPDHPNVASSLDNLGAITRALGAYEDARALHERALAIWERAVGADHPGPATSASSLAVLHLTLGNQAQAMTYSLRALEIRERVLGPDHPDVAMSLDSLAALQWRSGDHAASRATRERALRIREKALGPDHPHVAHSLTNLASTLSSLGEHAQARAQFERALSIWENKLGPEHPNLVHPLTGLAKVALDQKRPEDASRFAERAIDLLEKTSGLPQKMGEVKFLLARALSELGRRSDALEAAAQAREAMEDAPDAAEATAEIEAWLAARTDPPG